MGSRLRWEQRVQHGWDRAYYLILLVQNSLETKLTHTSVEKWRIVGANPRPSISNIMAATIWIVLTCQGKS